MQYTMKKATCYNIEAIDYAILWAFQHLVKWNMDINTQYLFHYIGEKANYLSS